MVDTLADEIAAHLAKPFPTSIEKGLDYGEVDAVMIDADIHGWASHAVSGVTLRGDQRVGLSRAADELERSLPAFPEEARDYYAQLLRIARLALVR